MRALKCLYTVYGMLVFCIQLQASTTTVTTQLDVQSTQQPLGISGVTSSPQTQNIRSSAGFTTDSLGKGFSLESKFIVDQPDYSSVQLRDSQNQIVGLTGVSKNEFQTETRLNWAKTSHFLSAGYFGHLSLSPYETRGGFFEYEKSFFEKTTMLGAQFSLFEQNRPVDFFTDRDSFLKQRPTLVHANQISMHVEQVINSKWKIKSVLSTAKRFEERPRNYGLEVKSAYAFNPQIFGVLSAAYYEESQAEPLLNERGYFKAYLSQAEITMEPIYDIFISLSYGFSAEIESDPRNSTSSQVGIDQYGMGLKFNLRNSTVFIQGATTRSNALTSTTKVTGGLAWNI